MLRKTSGLLALIVITGCAKHPNDIVAARIDMTQFNNLDCASIATRQSETKIKLAEEEETQKTLWALDIMLPIPPTGTVFNRDSEIARLKGSHQALREISNSKRCG